MATQFELRFDGADIDQARDSGRLTGQLARVWEELKGGSWKSLADISKNTGDPEASISAQLRNLRKKRFGAHTIERRHIKNGLYQYRLLNV